MYAEFRFRFLSGMETQTSSRGLARPKTLVIAMTVTRDTRRDGALAFHVASINAK